MALLSELTLFVVAQHSRGVRELLYDSNLSLGYKKATDLKELMNLSILGFRPYADFYGFRLNSRGFRSPEYTRKKPASVYRVLVLGDSFAFASGGVPYPRVWPTLLGGELREDRSREVEVVNLGVPGVEMSFELRLWQVEGSALQADLVILAFCIGNDIPLPVTDTRSVTSLAELSRRSRTVRLLRNVWRIWHAGVDLRGVEDPSPHEPGGKGGFEIDGYEYDPNLPTYERQAFLEIVARRMRVAHPSFSSRMRQGVEIVVAQLREIDLDVRAAGGRFLVVLVPEEYQLYPGLAQEAAEVSGLPAGSYEVRRPQAVIGEKLDEAGVPWLDLWPDFAKEAPGRPLYRNQDTHWNAEGNRLAAAAIGEYLLAGKGRGN